MPRARVTALKQALDGLLRAVDIEARAAADPVSFARRYADPGDAEVAALLASALAFGRVAGFRTVLEGVFARADAAGGPRAWVSGPPPDLRGLAHRWTRSDDLALLVATLGETLRRGQALEALFRPRSGEHDIGPALDRGVGALRAVASALAGKPYAALPQGFRHLLPTPETGSACKRWCMFMRWMVRKDPPDLGLWPHSAARLVVPLDTHVHRLGLLLGLTRRADASWRTALDLTRNLRHLCPEDPVRYDFALAHLGISGACRREHDARICRACDLARVCLVLMGAATG